MKEQRFKDGDLIKRGRGKVIYRFMGYIQKGRFGDMHITNTETNIPYTVFSSVGGWELVSSEKNLLSKDLFPIY